MKIEQIEKLSKNNIHIMVRFPSNEETIKLIPSVLEQKITGIIIDWDFENNQDTIDLAICTS